MVVDEAFVELKTDAGKTYFWNRRENTRTWSLPEGISVKWVGQKAPDGRTYYWCRETKETIWLLPPLEKKPEAAAAKDPEAEADAAVAAAEGSPAVPATSSTASASRAAADKGPPLKGLALLRAAQEPLGPRGDSASAVAARHVIEKSGCDSWFYRNPNGEWEEALLFWPPPENTPLGSKPKSRKTAQDPHCLRDLIHRCQQHEDMARALFYAHHGAIMKFSPKQYPLPQQNEWAFWTCEGKQLLVDADAPLPSEEDIASNKPLPTPVMRRSPPEGGKWKMLTTRVRGGLSMIYNARKLRSLEVAIKKNDAAAVQSLMDELSTKVPEGLQFRAKLCLLPAPPAKQPPPQRPASATDAAPASPTQASTATSTTFPMPPAMPSMPPMPIRGDGTDPILAYPKQPPASSPSAAAADSAATAASAPAPLYAKAPPPAAGAAAAAAVTAAATAAIDEQAASSASMAEAATASAAPVGTPAMLMKAPPSMKAPPMTPAPPPAPVRQPAWKAPGPGPGPGPLSAPGLDGGPPTKAPPVKAPPSSMPGASPAADAEPSAAAQGPQQEAQSAASSTTAPAAAASPSRAEAQPVPEVDVEAAAKEWQKAASAPVETDAEAPWKRRRRAPPSATAAQPGKKGQADTRSAAKLVASAERIAAATDPKKQAQALAAEEKLRKKVVVSNVPASASNVDLADFFTGAVFSATGHTLAAEWQSGAAKVVVGVERSSASKNASVHFGTALGASVALMLNGIQFQGHALSLKRPTGYTGPNVAPKLKGLSIKELVATSGKGSEGRAKSSTEASDRKVRLSGIPVSMVRSSVFDLLQQFGGPLKELVLPTDAVTGRHSGLGSAEFVESSSASDAISRSPLLGLIHVTADKKAASAQTGASSRKRPRRSRFDPTPDEAAKKKEAPAGSAGDLGPFEAALGSRLPAVKEDAKMDLGPFESVLPSKASSAQPSQPSVLEAVDDLGPFEAVIPAAKAAAKELVVADDDDDLPADASKAGASKSGRDQDDDTVEGSDTEADDDEEFDPFSSVLPPKKKEALSPPAAAPPEDGSDTEADDDDENENEEEGEDEDDLGPFNAVLRRK